MKNNHIVKYLKSEEEFIIKKIVLITTSLLLGIALMPGMKTFAQNIKSTYETGIKTCISERAQKGADGTEQITPKNNNVGIPETKMKLKETAIDSPFWATHNLNMRSGAGVGHKRIITIPKSKEVKAVAKVSNGWYKITYSGKTGYVSGKYLSKNKIAPPKQVASTDKYAPMTIHFPDKIVPFKNGGIANGQSIIDKNTKIASTWGGAETFSGSDGMNTHIVAHNPGAFAGIWNYSIGAKIIIVDHSGNRTTYSISDRFIVYDNGDKLDGSENMYNYITSTMGGEVVTFQTCKNSSENWIIRAEKVN